MITCDPTKGHLLCSCKQEIEVLSADVERWMAEHMEHIVPGLRELYREGWQKLLDDARAAKRYEERRTEQVPIDLFPPPARILKDMPEPDELSATADVFRMMVDWSRYPKMAEIFQHRPSVNIYWHELINLAREMAQIERQMRESPNN